MTPTCGIIIEFAVSAKADKYGRAFYPMDSRPRATSAQAVISELLDNGPDSVLNRTKAAQPDFITFHCPHGSRYRPAGSANADDPYSWDALDLLPAKARNEHVTAWRTVVKAWRRHFPGVPIGVYLPPPWQSAAKLEAITDPRKFADAIQDAVAPFADPVNMGGADFFILDACNGMLAGDLSARVWHTLPQRGGPMPNGLEAWAMKQPGCRWHESPRFSHWCDSLVYQTWVEGKNDPLHALDAEIAGPRVTIEKGDGIPDADRWGNWDGKSPRLAYDRAVSHLKSGRCVALPSIWHNSHPLFRTCQQLKGEAGWK